MIAGQGNIKGENGGGENRLQFAVEAAKLIPYAYDRAQAFYTIADYLLRAGDRDLALDKLERALEAADSISDTSLKIIILCDISGRFRDGEEISRSESLLSAAEDFLQAVEKPTSKVKAMTALAGGYWKAGLYEEEYQLLHQALNQTLEIEDDSVKANAFSEIAQRYLAAGEVNIALQVARSIAMAYQRALTLANIGIRLLDKAEEKYAETVINEALGIVEKMTYPNLKAETLADIAGIFLEFGESGRAKDILSRAGKETKKIEPRFLKASAIAKLSSIYGFAGDMETARELFAEADALASVADKPFLQALFFASVSGKYAYAGMFNVAAAALLRALDMARKGNQQIKIAVIKETVKALKQLTAKIHSGKLLKVFNDSVNTLKDENLKVWAKARVAVDTALYSAVWDEGIVGALNKLFEANGEEG